MRIVSRQELMAMPPGTLFHVYEPCIFQGLQIKGETCKTDFWTAAVPQLDVNSSEELFERSDAMDKQGASWPMDFDSEGREGLFDETMRYAVWERADVEKFHAKLGAILRGEVTT